MSNPTTGVWQLDGDLDGEPSALTGSGAIRYDDGLWLEEATTNMIANPTGESNTTNWACSTGNGTIGRGSSPAGARGWHLSCTRSNASGFMAVQNQQFIVCAASTVYALTVPAQSPTIASVNIGIRWLNSGFGHISTTTKGVTAIGSSDFVDLIYAVTSPVGAAYALPEIVQQSGGTIGDVLYLADMQLEAKSYATSFAEDSLGTGYSNSPSPHSRAASSASIDPTGILSPASGALAMRLAPTIETGVEEIWGECGVKGAGTDHIQWGRDATKHPFVEWSANDAAYTRLAATGTIDAGTQAFIYLGHDGTAITLQVDAGSLQSDTRDAVEDDFSTGDLTLQASAGGVIYDDFATFDRTLTATEIAQVRRAGSFSLGMFDGNPYIHFQLRPY